MHIVLNATALIPLLYKVPKDMISCGWRRQHLTEDFGTERGGHWSSANNKRNSLKLKYRQYVINSASVGPSSRDFPPAIPLYSRNHPAIQQYPHHGTSLIPLPLSLQLSSLQLFIQKPRLLLISGMHMDAFSNKDRV